MTPRRRRVFMGLAPTALICLLLSPLAAQDSPKAPPADAAAERKMPDHSRRVPAHFAKVGLAPAQREAIYKVRARHQEAIDAIHKQLEREQAAMMTECEAVLTPEQKSLLLQHRRGLPKDKKAAEDSTTAAASKPDSEE